MYKRARIRVTGIVQGVGFRPFVYNLAVKHSLAGFCLNDSEGVVIEVEGHCVGVFIMELRSSPPPLSKIESLTVESIAPRDDKAPFTIKESVSEAGKFVLISPDIAICPDCRRELFTPSDRRYLYPFINCTNCGPRYSIVKDIPYDRPRTTMAPFVMCPECEREYKNPADRRFHAQPNACERCGPKVWLAAKDAQPCYETNYRAIVRARELLRDGAILAIKGLGGFHIACDAANGGAVRRLRNRKRKTLLNSTEGSNKPFAVMSPDVESIKSFAVMTDAERAVLESRTSPIVLLEKVLPNPLSDAVSPNNGYFGVMLPYTPLHCLLMRTPPDKPESRFAALVMTSGNLSEEPIVISNEEAAEKLSGIADFFLLHDRDIYMRVDDSIVRLEGKRPRMLRRSRGFTPGAIDLREELREILACGAEVKNTLCITKGRNAILSQHIGDLENLAAMDFFEETLKNLKNTFRADPVIVAHDLHPDYLSTRFALAYAKEKNIPPERLVAVQHHHAHIVSCMAEHGIKGDVIGVSFDGTGYGSDCSIWGGEFMLSSRRSFLRKAHLDYVALPGGDKAIKEPWRMALSYLHHTYGDGAHEASKKIFERLDPQKAKIILKMLHRRVNSPLTSSAGRLFDAVSSLIGVRDVITFEGEAAVELEFNARRDSAASLRPYSYAVIEDDPLRIDLRPLIKDIVDDSNSGTDKSVISGRFHNTIGEIILEVSRMLKEDTGINDVVLSGGVFQNALLSDITRRKLTEAGFKPWYNERVPTNDGGVSLGQAVIAWENVKNF